jgi:hypothetical protein
MQEVKIPRLDKSTFTVVSLTDNTGEKDFWLSKSPYERLEAVEMMRKILYGYDPLTTRLQRFFEVAQRTSN